MRLKEFLICTGIFTVCYILFFIVVDKISDSIAQKNEKNRIAALINGNSFAMFANFYGIQSSIDKEKIRAIFEDLKSASNIKISSYSTKHGISIYEFVVVCLFLEFLNLIGKRNISIEEDTMNLASYTDQNCMNKYYSCFTNHYDCNKIAALLGNKTMSELEYLNNKFLIPGVRLIESRLYYIGDICEKG